MHFSSHLIKCKKICLIFLYEKNVSFCVVLTINCMLFYMYMMGRIPSHYPFTKTKRKRIKRKKFSFNGKTYSIYVLNIDVLRSTLPSMYMGRL